MVLTLDGAGAVSGDSDGWPLPPVQPFQRRRRRFGDPTAKVGSGAVSGHVNVWSISNGSSTSNWTTNAAGTTATGLIPGAGTTVYFSATGAGSQGSMVLGDPMRRHGRYRYLPLRLGQRRQYAYLGQRWPHRQLRHQRRNRHARGPW